ncbi:MAG: DUF2238 domain-containing protein [Proteobacteria bacterium]|nr:DUF2238 domain-containing protein [Pseudomonadota bacterium]
MPQPMDRPRRSHNPDAGAVCVCRRNAAIAPVDRFTWGLENLLVVSFVAVFLFSYRLIQWSGSTLAAVVGFLTLHAVGAHFTYSEVPYQDWLRALGVDQGPWFTPRNHFDRAVHLLYGALLTLPMVEWLRARGYSVGRAAMNALAMVMCSSLLYEFFEWGACLMFGSDEGMAFLGTQGDGWDAHKDMFAATAGSLLSAGLLMLKALAPRLKSKSWGRRSGLQERSM